MSEQLPVTMYWSVVAGGAIVAVFPLALKKEAEQYADQINEGRKGEHDAKTQPAAIQGWLVAPGRMP